MWDPSAIPDETFKQNLEQYRLSELLELEKNPAVGKHPTKLALVRLAINARVSSGETSDGDEWLTRPFARVVSAVTDEAAEKPQVFRRDGQGNPIVPPPDQEYQPNSVSLANRIVRIVIAVVALVYCIHGLIQGTITLPGGRGHDLEFTGTAAYLYIASLLMAVAYSVLIVVDHYDRRNNERIYKEHRKLLNIGSLVLALLAFLLQMLARTSSGS